ncbi:MAG TPA: aldo/keto reductase [Bacteroidota bacterium]|nr:aldo/keto reductase [Bacteroidota bacterium]
METDFTHTVLGKTGLRVHRLGLAASYFPGATALERGVERGMNYFFGYGSDFQMKKFARTLFARDRDRYVLATGVYNLKIGYPDIRRTLEKRLRQFGTEYIDLFLFLGVMKEKEFPPKARDEMLRLKDEGKIRFVGMSCHDRKFAGRMAGEGALDALMIRYNAAHRGAEEDIFPHCAGHDPGIVSYTATRWTYLLRAPKGWPAGGRVPDAGLCYRFALSHPAVHVTLTAPRSVRELDQNLDAVERGPLAADDASFMRSFGDAVHHAKKWFM